MHVPQLTKQLGSGDEILVFIVTSCRVVKPVGRLTNISAPKKKTVFRAYRGGKKKCYMAKSTLDLALATNLLFI